jgi:hypothetical protein
MGVIMGVNKRAPRKEVTDFRAALTGSLPPRDRYPEGVFILGKENPMDDDDDFDFTNPPRIGHRSDALYLLDKIIAAVEEDGGGYLVSLEAVRDAIERGIV